MSDVRVAWFEVPVADLERAVRFYGKVLDAPMATMPGPQGDMHVFVGADGPVGALTRTDSAPAAGGVIVYFDSDDIDAALDRVTAAGGTVVQQRTSIGPYGFIGQFLDSEGNTLALHSEV